MNSGVRDGYRNFFVLGFAESATARAALSPERRDPGGVSRRDLAVGERSVTHGPQTSLKPASGQDANYPYCRSNNILSQTSQNNVVWLM